MANRIYSVAKVVLLINNQFRTFRKGTLGHALVSNLVGNFHAINNPNVIRFAFDVGYRRALAGLATITRRNGPRPDVLLGYSNGSVQVNNWAVRMNKWFGN